MGRALRHHERNEPAGAARAQDRAACRELDQARDGSRATSSCWCASAAPCSNPIIRALKAADIPVAGADRLVLTEHIAVMDLMALADALLLPEDDLALASVLKSPLFGLSDEELFKIAWNRGALSLRAALAAQARQDLLLAEAARTSGRACSAPQKRNRPSPSTPAFSARMKAAGNSSRGSAPEANDAHRRIPQSRARLREARGAVAAGLHRVAARRRRPRSSATWNSRATKCA